MSLEHYNAELASIDMEIARLAQICGIQMLQPGVAEAVLRNDSSLCNSTNPLVCTLPVGTLPGTYTVTYTATDGTSSASDTLAITVTPVADTPSVQVTIGAQGEHAMTIDSGNAADTGVRSA